MAERAAPTHSNTIKRLKKERAVLKKAVLDDLTHRSDLEDTISSLSKGKRRLEEEIQSHQEEIDRLGFANEQLKRRINQMIKEFKEQEVQRASVSSNGSMLGLLLGSGTSAETNKLQQQLQVLQEELHIKIHENECVLIKQFELQREHEEQITILRKRVVKSKHKYIELQRELASKQKCIEELVSEKEDQTKRRTVEANTYDEARASMHQRYRDMADANAELNAELDLNKQRLRDKIPFDDGEKQHWNVWTLPPHDHKKERSLVCGCARGVLAACALAETYAACCDAEGRLLRIRTHHPTTLGGVADVLRDQDIMLRDQDIRIKESLYSRMARVTRVMMQLESFVSTPSLCAVGGNQEGAGGEDPGVFSSSSSTTTSSTTTSSTTTSSTTTTINTPVSIIESFLFAHNQLMQLTTTKNSTSEAASCHAVHKTIRALCDCVLRRWTQREGNITSTALHGALNNTLVVDVLKENDYSLLGLKWSLLLSWIVKVARESPSFVVQFSALVDDACRALRERATIVAQRVAVEQRQPFVPKAVRTCLNQLQTSEFNVATSGERFAESIRYVVETSRNKTLGESSGDGWGRNRPHGSHNNRNYNSSNTNDNDNDLNSDKTLEMASLLQQMRGTLSTKSKSYHHWIKSKKLIKSLPHSSAVKFRDELEQTTSNNIRLEKKCALLSDQNDLLRKTMATNQEEYTTTLSNVVAERNQAQEELRRFKEERIVSDMTTAETERNLRNQLLDLKKNIDNNNVRSTLHSPHRSSPASDPSSDPFSDPTRPHQPHPSVDTRNEHTHVSGSAKYTLHVLDYDGVVRGLNSLRLPKEEETRENKIRRYYENQLKTKDVQLGQADAVATRLHDKYRSAVSKLQQLMRSSQRHERSLKDGSERVSRAKEELQATREAMAAQSAMLTTRVMELEEAYTKAQDMVDHVTNNELRCVHCHGWNRIGRIVGQPGDTPVPCIHCQKNSGFRCLG